jgi:hypothetical protein
MTTVLETPQDVMALLDEFTRRVRADNVMGDPLLCLLSSEILEDTGLTVDELPSRHPASGLGVRMGRGHHSVAAAGRDVHPPAHDR